MEFSALKPRLQDADRPAGQVGAVAGESALRLPRAPANGLAMSLERRRLQFYLLLVLVDAALILGSFAVANALHPLAFVTHEFMLPAYMLLPLFQTIAFYNATYSRDGLTNWRSAVWRGLLALLVSALLFNFFAFFAKANADFSRVVFVSGLAGAWSGMILVRIALAWHIHRNWGPSATNRLVIEAGGPPVAIANVYRVNSTDHGLRPDMDDPLALDRLSKYLANMDMVIVSCGPEQRLAWSEVLRGSGIHGEVISDFAKEIGALAIVRHEDANVTALVVSLGHLGLRQRVIKRGFDMAIALLALVLLSPVLLACAAAIAIDDGAPVFFRQRRMGRGNQFFDIFKFRTMRNETADAQGLRSAARDDDRITRVGRFLRRTSLDELPQLLNVVRGDMSTVAIEHSAAGRTAGAGAAAVGLGGA
jgi:polysaccharide biosynthesis protein PslA